MPTNDQSGLGLDPDLYEKLRRRQKVRKEHTLRDVAATFKLGERPDYTSGFRRLQDKQAMMAPLAGQLAQLETYYFGREFDARQNEFNQTINSARAAVQAETSKLQVMAGSAKAAAVNGLHALGRNMDDTQARMDMLQEMSPMGQNFIQDLSSKGLVRPGSRNKMTQMAAQGKALQVVQDIKAEWAKVTDPNSTLTDVQKQQTMKELQEHVSTYGGGAVLGGADWEENYVKSAAPVLLSEDHAAINQEAGAVNPDAPPLLDPRSPEVVRMLGNVLQNQTAPGQQGADVLGILNAIGVPSEEAIYAIYHMEGGAVLAKQLDRAVKAAAEAKWTMEEEQARNAKDLETLARKTYPDSKPLAASLDALQETTNRHNQARQAAGMEGPPSAMGELGEPGALGEAGGAPGAAGAGGPVDPPGQGMTPPDERTQNFYDIIADTSGSAPERFLRMMGAITEFPDLPPAADLKAQIMGSDKLKDYMASRGLKDPDVAFRLMNREARVIHRNNRRGDRAKIKKLREQGVILSRGEDVDRPESLPRAAGAQQAIVDRATSRAKQSLAGEFRDTEPDIEIER